MLHIVQNEWPTVHAVLHSSQFFSTLNVETFLRVVLRLLPIASMVNMIGLVVGVVPEQ